MSNASWYSVKFSILGLAVSVAGLSGCLFFPDETLPSGTYLHRNDTTGARWYITISGRNFTRVDYSGGPGNRSVLLITGHYVLNDDYVSFKTGTWDEFAVSSDTLDLDTVNLSPAGCVGCATSYKVKSISRSGIDFGFESYDPYRLLWWRYIRFSGKLYEGG